MKQNTIMDFRTTFNIDPSGNKINYDTPVLFIGSCFSAEIGKKLGNGKMKVLINPAGVVYNPVSVSNTIENIIENKVYAGTDLYKFKKLYVSFAHYSDFTSENQAIALKKINSSARKAYAFLKSANFLFITFGTARIYRMPETGKIVSNCHKLPQSYFTSELLGVEDIVNLWKETLDRLHYFNKDLKVIFTVSPVRHWKDGAHGNQISKAVLFLAIERLLEHKVVDGYFPAYELIMDDLRDYRFYAEDMLHPSEAAIDYIWEAFSRCYFNNDTMALWKEINGITIAMNHRFLTDTQSGKLEFADNMLKRISAIEKKYPAVKLPEETSYFVKLRMEIV